ncbi:MAG: alpha/beta hydrolase [Candidatus Azotimanducaceae bacterium]
MTAIIDESGLPCDALALWTENVPLADGSAMIDQPILTIHRAPEDRSNGAACIVAPGGGYRILASDHEGLQVARWLNRKGITCFVLRYRVGPKYHSSVSLIDGLRAVRYVRCFAEDYKIDSDRIGMLGFSAGGHLTVAVGTGWDSGKESSIDPIEKVSSRPDFLVPVYAVTNGAKRGRKADEYTSTDEQVNSQTPPTFIVHTHEDSIVPASQSTLFYDALLAQGVPAELHIFNKGEHGLGMMLGDPDVAEWGELLLRWLRRQKLMTRQPRIKVSGKVLRGGQPMGMVWITFIPDDVDAPIARTRIQSDSGGSFSIDTPEGPVAGRHSVKIYHVSNQETHVATGVYTMDDAQVCETTTNLKGNDSLVFELSEEDFKTI